MQVGLHLQNGKLEFVCQGHWVKAKVTGANYMVSDGESLISMSSPRNLAVTFTCDIKM